MKAKHDYANTYARLFYGLRGRKDIKIAEVGVWRGSSIRAMLRIFPDATIYGIDTTHISIPGATIVAGDGYSEETWGNLPRDFDLIIDDGSHYIVDMIRGMKSFMSHTAVGGYVLIEDIPTERDISTLLSSFPGGTYIDTRDTGADDDRIMLWKRDETCVAASEGVSSAEGSRISLLSFATKDWTKSRARFVDQLADIQHKYRFFKKSEMLSEDDLDHDFFDSPAGKLWNASGNGKQKSFYAWKPYILLSKLNQMNEGDILMYADAGCSFPGEPVRNEFMHAVRRFADRLASLGDDKLHIVLPAWSQNPQCASCCCTSLLSFFGLTNCPEFTRDFPHYEAGVMLMVNNERTRSFMRLWWGTMRDSINRLFDDAGSGLRGFVHNSCDQAVMQALLYLVGADVVMANSLFYGYGYYCRMRG